MITKTTDKRRADYGAERKRREGERERREKREEKRREERREKRERREDRPALLRKKISPKWNMTRRRIV